jgi:starch phosphorylase
VDGIWRQTEDWTHKAILNTVRMGWFSSDRTIREYAREIWNVPVA